MKTFGQQSWANSSYHAPYFSWDLGDFFGRGGGGGTRQQQQQQNKTTAGPQTKSATGGATRGVSYEVRQAFLALGITAKNPSRQQIDAAYKAKKAPLRKAAKTVHPDTSSASQEAAMKRVAENIAQVDKAFRTAMQWAAEDTESE